MKIQVNNLCLFHTLSDICPDPTTTLRRIFFDYVVNSKGRFVTSDNKVIETSFPKIEELYRLLNTICKDKIDSIWLQYWSKSSRKRISNMVDSMLMFFGLTQVNDYYTISRIGTAKLLDVIYGRFFDKWGNLWSLYLKPYDALSPYQVKKNIKTIIDKMRNNSDIQSDLSRALSEDGTINYGKIVDEVKSGNRTLQKVFKSAIETTKAGKETNELKNDMSEHSINPFNATGLVKTDQDVNSSTNELSFTDRKDTDSHTGSDTDTETFNNISNKNSESGTDSKSNTTQQTDNKNITTTYQRENTFEQNINFEGNIGNHTIQELIKQEREKYMYQIFDTIYQDLDSVLVRKSYDIERRCVWKR